MWYKDLKLFKERLGRLSISNGNTDGLYWITAIYCKNLFSDRAFYVTGEFAKNRAYANANDAITLFAIQMQMSMHYVIVTAIVIMADFEKPALSYRLR